MKEGNALQLPLDNESVDVAAQNCQFNRFKQNELKIALKELFRVLKPHGKVCEQNLLENFKNDETLRALCPSVSIPLDHYTGLLIEIGFGTIEIRVKRPCRIIDSTNYNVTENYFIESVEVCAIKDPLPEDGPCIFTGKSAIYYGKDSYFDDKKGHTLFKNQPLSVCDKTAGSLTKLDRNDIFISDSTYFYNGGGCC